MHRIGADTWDCKNLKIPACRQAGNIKRKKVVEQKFFLRPSPAVARSLLGKILVRRVGRRRMNLMITETEAYGDANDLASHARFGKTRRNKVMFEEGRRWYVYLVYGIHWLLNLISGPKGKPSGVLIRSGVLLDGGKILNGPGVITKTLRIDGKLNEKLCDKKSGLWIEDRGIKIPQRLIKNTPRVGVEYADRWAKKRWRFFVKLT